MFFGYEDMLICLLSLVLVGHIFYIVLIMLPSPCSINIISFFTSLQALGMIIAFIGLLSDFQVLFSWLFIDAYIFCVRELGLV